MVASSNAVMKSTILPEDINCPVRSQNGGGSDSLTLVSLVVWQVEVVLEVELHKVKSSL